MKKPFLFAILIALSSSLSAQKFEWVNFEPLNAFVTARPQVAADAAGNTYELTYYAGQLIVQGDTLNAPYLGEDLLIKFNPQGSVLWKKHFNGNNGSAEKLAVDASGHIYASIFTQSDTLIIGDTSYASLSQYHVIQFDSAGNFRRVFFQPSGYVTEIATLGNDLYVAYDETVAKMDTNLNVIWSRTATPGSAFTFGATSFNRGDIYVSPNGNISVMGHEIAGGTVQFDTVTFNFSGGFADEVMVARMDTAGNVYWVRTKDPLTTGTEYSNASAIDNSGNVYWSLLSNDLMIFGGDTLINLLNVGSYYAAMVKYDSAGNEQWAVPLYGNTSQFDINDLLVNAQQDVLLAGSSGGNAVSLIGDVNLLPGDHSLIAKLNPAGDVIWAKTDFADSNPFTNDASSIALLPSGDYAVAGFYPSDLNAPRFGCYTAPFNTNGTYVALLSEASEPVPAVDFSFGQNEKEISFSNATTNADSYYWNFGDGNSSTLVSPFHTYTTPGVYDVYLTATNSCGSATKYDTIAVNGLSKIVSDHGGNDGVTTATAYGGGFTTTSIVRLKRIGFSDIIPVIDTLAAPDQILVRLDLTGQAIGDWDVVVMNPTDTFTLTNGFHIQPALTDNIELTYLGTTGGKRLITAYAGMKITNNNNSDAVGVPLFFKDNKTIDQALINSPFVNTAIDPFFNNTWQYLLANSIDTLVMGMNYIDDDPTHAAKIGALIIPLIKPNSSVTVNLYTGPQGYINYEKDMVVFLPLEFSTAESGNVSLKNDFCFSSWVKNAVAKSMGITINSNEWDNCFPSLYDSVLNYIATQAISSNQLIPVPAMITYVVSTMSTNGCISNLSSSITSSQMKDIVLRTISNLGYQNDVSEVGTECPAVNQFKLSAEDGLRDNEFCDIVMGFGAPASFFTYGAQRSLCMSYNASIDPNSKYGPGSIDYPFVNPGSHAAYSISFENSDTATAAAQFISVMDTLDLSKIIPSSFQFGSVAVGDSITINADENKLSQFFVKDLRPAQPFYLKVEMNFDTTSGVATWKFFTLDTITLQPITDPIDGFLPPNTDSISGTGDVSFSVLFNPSLTTGDEISNRASIVFDFNDPILTNTWTNVVDITPPHSAVNTLPDTIFVTDFNVTWDGIDTVAGIRSYSVYVSDNDAPYELWISNTDTQTAIYQGTIGHKYEFFSIATDIAGNREEPPADPDNFPDAATTIVSGIAGQEAMISSLDIYPNPFTEKTTIEFSLMKERDVAIQLNDVIGSAVRKIDLGKLQAGTHHFDVNTADLAQGVYSLKVNADDQEFFRKLVKQ